MIKFRLEWSINGQAKWLEYYKATTGDLESLECFREGLRRAGHPVRLFRIFEL